MTVFGRPPVLFSYPIMKTNNKVIGNQLGPSDQLGNGKAEQGRFEEGLEKVIGHTVELEDGKSQGEGITNTECRVTKGDLRQGSEKEDVLQARVEAARRVRERSGVFDVAAAGTSALLYGDEEESAHGMWEMEEVEPWHEPVDGAALLDELATVVRRFVVLPKNAPEALALWCVHTYAFRLRDVSTYLGIESPEKRCGKTTLLTVLSELVNRPVVASNISSPAFFRVIEETRPTLLIDEADTFLQGNDELRGILNSGYSRKTAYVVRVAERAAGERMGRSVRLGERETVRGPQEMTNSECRRTVGKNEQQASSLRLSPPLAEEREDLISERTGRSVRHGERETVRGPQEMTNSEWRMTNESNEGTLLRRGYGGRGGSRLMRFSCWCPKVVAAIGRLPETLADRCIVIRMQRKTAHEECERLRYLESEDLRRKCARFVRDHASEIGKARPVLPGILNDRAGDIWEPLLALADLAGGEWPQKARQAAEGLTSVAQESSPIGSLLWDILLMFVKSERERLFSRWMVGWLNEMPDRPWGEMRKGKAVDERWLAQQLRPYGIKSKTMWIEEEAAKGYENEDFTEVYRRYIPRSEYDAMIAEQNERPKAESGGQS
jgi:hypothetical protein